MAERAERRLVTILAADIAGYSRLMRADEDATLAALGACRSLLDARIEAHKGRIANTAGDAVLAEFPSVSDGLLCALAIQEARAVDVPGRPRAHARRAAQGRLAGVRRRVAQPRPARRCRR
jgi:adenylate cyclase